MKAVYGNSALISINISTPMVTEVNTFKDLVQNDYWDQMDYMIDKAAEM